MHVKRILSVTTLLLSLCLGGGGGRAQAQDDDPEVVRMAKEHYKLGQDAYKAGKYDLAIKELKKAYLLKRIPAILINIGLTYRKMKDYDMSIYFFRKFLAEAPAEDKQRPQAEAELGEVEAEKAAALAQPRQGSKPAVEAAPKAKGQPAAAVPAAGANPSATGTQALQAPTAEWAHTPIDAVPPEMPVDVRVQMPVMKGVKVKVFFRKEGQATFDSLELKRRGNEKIARLPAEVASGRTFQYYIEARDGAGTLVKSSGSEASPNIVLIDKSAKQQVAGQEAAEGPDDEELAKKGKSFSRDIENEAVTFDPKALEQKRMMERLHQQVRDEGPKKKPVFSTIGWAGVGVLGGGVLLLAGGSALLGVAKSYETLIMQDSSCDPASRVKVNGVRQCPHYSGNPDPTLSGYSPSPSTAEYNSNGQTFNTAGIALAAVGGVAMASGGVLMIYDVLHQRELERARHAPKKRKVKKVIEIEEPTTMFQLSPVVSPTVVGLFGQLRF